MLSALFDVSDTSGSFPMKANRLILVQMSSVTRGAARAAALLAFPDVEAIEVNSVAEAALAMTSSDFGLMVLSEPDAVSVASATSALDHVGLPRWAVVVLGGDLAEFAETVPAAEWSPPLLSRTFRAALLQHELLRQNIQLRGDLRTMARRVSHDLYTPVGCIYTSSHVLKAMLPQDSAPSVADLVRNIEESSAEVAQIIDRVSFILRASADPSPLAPVDMGDVLADALAQLDPHLKRVGATVDKPASWPEVAGVPQWLQVVWWNLLNNALKHGDARSQIRVAWASTERGYRFSVINRGEVIAPAIQTAFFQPFDQLHLLRAPGLGLSFVQRLVALQGGACGYERLDDGSSSFFFTLPKGAQATHTQQDAARGENIHAVRPAPVTGTSAIPDMADASAGPARSTEDVLAGAATPS